MKIQYVDYDLETGVAYIAIGDKPKEQRAGIVDKSVSPELGIVIDYDKDGNVVGVEIY